MRIRDWSSDVCSSDLRTSAGEISYGLARTDSQLRARKFLRECRESIPFEMRGFMDRLLIHDDLPRYGGRKAMRSLSQIRGALDKLADFMRSEEHTSELQSLMRISYAVFCLKKTTQ